MSTDAEKKEGEARSIADRICDKLRRDTGRQSRDFTYADLLSVCLAGYTEGQKDAGRWIPVSERLPEDYLYVLISWTEGEDEHVLVGFYVGQKYNLDRWYVSWAAIEAPVTHWMPLPEPPKLEVKKV